MKTVGGKKRKLIITTNHHDDDDDDDDEKRSWSDLPYEMLELIKKRLFFIDQVKFSTICKSWSCIRRVAPLQQIPWLFVFDTRNSYLFENVVDSCKLVDSKNKKAYTIDTNVMKAKLKLRNFDNMRVLESKYGWLLMSRHSYEPCQQNGFTLFLYSPFFSEGYNLIELPLLPICLIFCATFTCNPLEVDCKILILGTNYADNNTMPFSIIINTYGCGQGSWSSSQKFELKFTPWYARQMIYSQGSFYYETVDNTMVKFNLALEEWTVLPKLPSTILYHHRYTMTSSDGELFLIEECNGKTRQNRRSLESRIYRLDLSLMIWEELDSIGDRVLFFGYGYNSIADSSVLKLNGERKNISDMIYYCKTDELRYCNVHDFTLKLGENEKPSGKKNCSRHYGSIATQPCRKMLIDPPPR